MSLKKYLNRIKPCFEEGENYMHLRVFMMDSKLSCMYRTQRRQAGLIYTTPLIPSGL